MFSIILEAGIVVSHVVWRIRTRDLHRKAKEAGIEFDDLPEARKYQGSERKEANTDVDMP
jgi:hypothetical protein